MGYRQEEEEGFMSNADERERILDKAAAMVAIGRDLGRSLRDNRVEPPTIEEALHTIRSVADSLENMKLIHWTAHETYDAHCYQLRRAVLVLEGYVRSTVKPE